VREACEELASDFACDFPLLPEEVELDFSSSRLARVPVDGLTGWADSYFPLSLPLRKLLSLGLLPDLDSTGGCDCWSIGIGIGRGRNASAGPGLPTVTARVATKATAALWIGRMRMKSSVIGMKNFIDMNEFRIIVTQAAARRI
jgi:hypothetical protein